MSDRERLKELKLRSARRGKSRANSNVTARLSGVRPIEGGGSSKRRRRRPILELVPARSNEASDAQVEQSAPIKAASPLPKFFQEYTDGVVRALLSVDIDEIAGLLKDLSQARADGRTIYVFGNGGSAVNALHFANKLNQSQHQLRKNLLRIISLNENIAALTAAANDRGFEQIYVNQLKSLLQPGDVVLGISADGDSPSVARALRFANENGAFTYAIVGSDGGSLLREAARRIHIPTPKSKTSYAEDVTMIIGHMMSSYLLEIEAES